VVGSRRHTKWSVLKKGLSETMGSDDGALTKVRDPVVAVVRWIKARSPKEKTYLGIAGAFVVGHAILPWIWENMFVIGTPTTCNLIHWDGINNACCSF
jgi:hypothetical protein